MIEIKAEQGNQLSDATEERFRSGGPMSTRPQSRTLMNRSALRLAVALLSLLSLFAVGAHAEIETSPEHFSTQFLFDVGTPDCLTAETASGQAHCQSPILGTVETYLTALLIGPTECSGVWSYAAATHNTTPIIVTLFRPPRLLSAHL